MKRSSKASNQQTEECGKLYFDTTMFHLEKIHSNMREIILGQHVERCRVQKLLPLSVTSAMEMAYFLSGVVETAQRVHCKLGVPASVLISCAASENGWDTADLLGEKGVAYFFRLGARLVKNRSFLPVIEAAGNPDALVAALRACSIWEKLEREDVINPIIDFHLAECDIFGNKYRADAAQKNTKRKSPKG